MQNEKIHTLAEKIAQLIEGQQAAPAFTSLQAGIERISERLNKLETASSDVHTAYSVSQSIHPSQEKFAVIEAVADEIFADLQKEKACAFEPNGKPCDHCSMCNSRGF